VNFKFNMSARTKNECECELVQPFYHTAPKYSIFKQLAFVSQFDKHKQEARVRGQ
jgi:hypothetical protein